MNDKTDTLPAQGRPPGGRTFGYRYELDPATGDKVRIVVPEQADVIREAAARVVADEPPSRIGRDLTARGVRGLTGAPVTASTVKSWVTNPTVAGLRQHRRELMRGLDGELVRGTWEPILDMGTWEACRARLAASARSGARPTRRKYLMSGLAWCAACDRKMSGQMMDNGRGDKTPFYRCKSCGAGISAEPVEEHVEDRLLDRLASLVDALADSEKRRKQEITTQLAGLRECRATAERKFLRGEMDELAYKAAKAEYQPMEADLLAELGELPARDARFDPDAVRRALQAAREGDRVDERRELIGTFIERVVVRRGRRGGSPGRTVDLSRVSILGPGWAEAE